MRQFIEAVASLVIAIILIIAFLGIVANSYQSKFDDINSRPKTNEVIK